MECDGGRSRAVCCLCACEANVACRKMQGAGGGGDDSSLMRSAEHTNTHTRSESFYSTRFHGVERKV